MKSFRKGISTIVFSSKLLLALGAGLPLCSFQTVQAGTVEILNANTQSINQGNFKLNEITKSIKSFVENHRGTAISAFNPFTNSLKTYINTNENSISLDDLNSIRDALLNTNGQYDAQKYSEAKKHFDDMIQFIDGLISKKSPTQTVSAPIKAQATNSRSKAQPAVDADLEKALQASIKTAKEENDRRAKASLEAQEIATEKERYQEEAAQRISTSSSLKTAAKVAGAAALATAAVVTGKAIYDKVTSDKTTPVNTLEEINKEANDLKAENIELEKQIADLTKGTKVETKNVIEVADNKPVVEQDLDLIEGKDYDAENDDNLVKKDETTSSSSTQTVQSNKTEKVEAVKNATATTKAKLKQILVKACKIGGYASIIALAYWLYMHPEMRQMIIEAAQELVAMLGSKVVNVANYILSWMPHASTPAPTCPLLPDGVTAQDVCNSPYSQLPDQYGIDCTAPVNTLADATSSTTATTSTPWYCTARSYLDPIFTFGGLFPVNNNCY